MNFGLGLLLGMVVFSGAFLGASVLRLPNCWLRHIYVVTVIAFALRLLLNP